MTTAVFSRFRLAAHKRLLETRSSAANVAQWNKINQNATFKAGQSVVIYVAMSAAGAKAEKSPQSAARTSEKPNARPVAKKLAPANVKQAKV
jgi:hypothetical protein